MQMVQAPLLGTLFAFTSSLKILDILFFFIIIDHRCFFTGLNCMLVSELFVIYLFCQLDTTWIIWKEGTSVKELPLSDWPTGMSVGGIFLTDS